MDRELEKSERRDRERQIKRDERDRNEREIETRDTEIEKMCVERGS